MLFEGASKFLLVKRGHRHLRRCSLCRMRALCRLRPRLSALAMSMQSALVWRPVFGRFLVRCLPGLKELDAAQPGHATGRFSFLHASCAGGYAESPDGISQRKTTATSTVRRYAGAIVEAGLSGLVSSPVSPALASLVRANRFVRTLNARRHRRESSPSVRFLHRG